MSQSNYRINRNRSEQSPTNSISGIQSPKRWYLLFAGSEQMPRGGLGDLVQTFGSDDMARTAFLALRLKGDSGASWAQLVVVDGEKGIQPLCWFGIGAAPNRSSTLFIHPDASGSQRRTRAAAKRRRFLSPSLGADGVKSPTRRLEPFRHPRSRRCEGVGEETSTSDGDIASLTYPLAYPTARKEET